MVLLCVSSSYLFPSLVSHILLYITYLLILIPFPLHFSLFNRLLIEIPQNRLHSINLDHDHVKMSWLVDWNSKEVFFHIANAFEGDYTWFSLGFSKRGEFERSDLCIFQWQNDLFNAVVVCVGKNLIINNDSHVTTLS